MIYYYNIFFYYKVTFITVKQNCLTLNVIISKILQNHIIFINLLKYFISQKNNNFKLILNISNGSIKRKFNTFTHKNICY